MKKFLTFLLAFLFLSPCYTQIKGIAQPIIANPTNAISFLAFDAFDYKYTVENNVFTKTKGPEFWEYKNVTLGKITRVDLENPLKIVLFYEDFNTVILLDNQLNEIQKINFSASTNINATASGIAGQNQLWVYNNLNQQIGLYEYLQKEYKTIGLPLTKEIKQYTTGFNNFVWIDVAREGYSCSIFGSIESLGQFPEADQLQIISPNQVLYSVGAKLIFLQRQKDKSWKSIPLELPEKRFEKFYYQAQNLAIFTPEGIFNYKITLP